MPAIGNTDHLRSEGDVNRTPRRDAWQAEHLDEDTRRILDEDAKYFLHQSLSTPCLNVLKGCEGAHIIDYQGRRILDFHGNNVHQVGFSHPKVIAAITEQLGQLSFCTRRYTNTTAIALAKKLTELAPGDLNKVLFAPGGAEAMGMALKLARYATGRFKTISMWDSFHGASLDMISLGGEAVFRRDVGPLLPGAEHVPPPDPKHCPFHCGDQCTLQCADYVEYVLEKEGDVAAVVAETVRSTPYVPPVDYWKRIRASCDKHGALLILDEIPTCLGRTGAMFVHEHYDIVPDMVVIGKGLGGGIFPLAALLVREHLDIARDRALGHYTHEKNPVACAAALATIDVLEGGVLENARVIGDYALERLHDLRHEFPLIGDVRGKGLMIGVELIRSDGARAIDEAEEVMYHALTLGLSFKVTMGNILTLTPTLTITHREMDEALAMLRECLAAVNHFPGSV
jgi:4-aminobutyrate aminotransferase